MARSLPSRIVGYEERSKLTRVREMDAPLCRGDLVVIRSRGDHRLARVTRVGRTRVATEYTTESALLYADRYGTPPIVTRKSVDMSDPWLLFVERPS